MNELERLRERVDALDRIEAILAAGTGRSNLSVPRARAARARLQAANRRLFRAIRRDILSGVGPARLLRLADARDGGGGFSGRADGESYDHLDVLINGVLKVEQPRQTIAPLPPEMVPYQPTPARHIFDAIRRSALSASDVLFDLGSGMGHVPLVASICTGARCVGIEREAAYVDAARRAASAMNLNNVSFVLQDARDADLSGGTIFYLYTPFTGAVLRAMLRALQQEASRRQIRICTFGPCTPAVASEAWLEPVDAPGPGRPAVFRSC